MSVVPERPAAGRLEIVATQGMLLQTICSFDANLLHELSRVIAALIKGV
ncbi:hypothetical protein [Mycobacterium sp. Lab-001]